MKIPGCKLPDTTSNEFIVQATSGVQNEQFADNMTQTANTFTVAITDNDGNAITEETCTEEIELCLSYIPDNLVIPEGETQWVYNDTWASDQVFTCRYWNESDWSTDGIDNTKTRVDFTAQTVCCYSTHSGTFAATLDRVDKAGSTEIIDTIDVIGISSKRGGDSDDDW